MTLRYAFILLLFSLCCNSWITFYRNKNFKWEIQKFTSDASTCITLQKGQSFGNARSSPKSVKTERCTDLFADVNCKETSHRVEAGEISDLSPYLSEVHSFRSCAGQERISDRKRQRDVIFYTKINFEGSSFSFRTFPMTCKNLSSRSRNTAQSLRTQKCVELHSKEQCLDLHPYKINAGEAVADMKHFNNKTVSFQICKNYTAAAGERLSNLTTPIASEATTVATTTITSPSLATMRFTSTAIPSTTAIRTSTSTANDAVTAKVTASPTYQTRSFKLSTQLVKLRISCGRCNKGQSLNTATSEKSILSGNNHRIEEESPNPTQIHETTKMQNTLNKIIEDLDLTGGNNHNQLTSDLNRIVNLPSVSRGLTQFRNILGGSNFQESEDTEHDGNGNDFMAGLRNLGKIFQPIIRKERSINVEGESQPARNKIMIEGIKKVTIVPEENCIENGVSLFLRNMNEFPIYYTAYFEVIGKYKDDQTSLSAKEVKEILELKKEEGLSLDFYKFKDFNTVMAKHDDYLALDLSLWLSLAVEGMSAYSKMQTEANNDHDHHDMEMEDEISKEEFEMLKEEAHPDTINTATVLKLPLARCFSNTIFFALLFYVMILQIVHMISITFSV